MGLDERTGFRPVTLTNPQALKQGLAAKARAYTPPVRLSDADSVVDGEPVVVATVHECDRSAKPCRVSSTGKAYLRSHDGNYELSDLEEQAFLAQRQPPHFDRRPVEGATAADLDPELLEAWTAAARERNPGGLGRFRDDAELLRRGGIISADGHPTVAGLLALGSHPQEWFPRYVIQAAADPRAGDPPGARARNQATIAGPIPRMLDDALAWARRTFESVIVGQPDGRVVDRPEYPLEAVRELVANALVHRDLDAWSEGLAIEVRLERDRLVVSNPGGLYGITVDRLGREAVTSARNGRLVSVCQDARSPGSGARVIEALATGIPIVAAALTAADLPPALFVDSGIRFAAVLRRPATRPVGRKLGATELRVYEALAQGPMKVADLETALHLTAANIRKALRSLRADGLVEQQGGPGRPTTYRQTTE